MVCFKERSDRRSCGSFFSWNLLDDVYVGFERNACISCLRYQFCVVGLSVSLCLYLNKRREERVQSRNAVFRIKNWLFMLYVSAVREI